MKHNPDDRRDNVERIQNNIDNTIKNMEIADEIIASTEDSKKKKALKSKNKRREDALEGMISEIKDEADARENKYR